METNNAKLLKQKLNALERELKIKEDKSIPWGIFTLGITTAYLLNLSTDFLFQRMKDNLLFEVVTYVGTFFIICFVFYGINKTFLKPVDDLRKNIKQIEKELEKIST